MDLQNDRILDCQAEDLIRDYKDGGPAELVVDTVQRQLECCGFLGVEDWAREAENLVQVRAARANNRSVTSAMWLPASCCKEAACSLGNAFAESCQDKIRDNYLNPNNAIGLLGMISSKTRIHLFNSLFTRNLHHRRCLLHDSDPAHLAGYVLHCKKVRADNDSKKQGYLTLHCFQSENVCNGSVQ